MRFAWHFPAVHTALGCQLLKNTLIVRRSDIWISNDVADFHG